jgi:hypothetical protein
MLAHDLIQFLKYGGTFKVFDALQDEIFVVEVQ